LSLQHVVEVFATMHVARRGSCGTVAISTQAVRFPLLIAASRRCRILVQAFFARLAKLLK
jgi:hypothetical protein